MATKFTAALSGLKEAKTKHTPEEAPATPPTPQPEPVAGPAEPARRKVGRPRGMRSDPNMEQTTIFLSKSVKELAQELLNRRGMTLSKLLDDYLSLWAIQALAEEPDRLAGKLPPKRQHISKV